MRQSVTIGSRKGEGGLRIPYQAVSNPKARGMELFLKFFWRPIWSCWILLFYYTQLVDRKATFLSKEKTKTTSLCCE